MAVWRAAAGTTTAFLSRYHDGKVENALCSTGKRWKNKLFSNSPIRDRGFGSKLRGIARAGKVVLQPYLLDQAELGFQLVDVFLFL